MAPLTLYARPAWAAFLRGFLALAVAFVHTAAPAAESAFWAERRRSLAGKSSPAEEPAVLAQAVLPFERQAAFPQVVPSFSVASGGRTERWAEAVLPYANLREVHRSTKANAPVILHVQDLHDVEEAQRNIAALIESLGRDHGVSLVGVEGASGDFVLDPIRRYVSSNLLSSAADYLLKTTLIGGPEYAGLVSADLLTLFGAEDLPLYRENLRAVRQAIKIQPELRKKVAALHESLSALKETRYPPALAEYDRRAEERRLGKGSLAEFVKYLLSRAPNVLPTPNLQRFAEAAAQERTLDFNLVAGERRRFLETLAARLSPTEVSELTALSLRHRAAAVGYEEFFRALDRLARAHNISWSRFPQLKLYREYAEISESISRVKFITELESLERAVENVLAATPEARRVVEASRRARLLADLVELSLSPDKWRTYRSDRAQIRRLPDTIREEGGPAVEFPDYAALEPFEDFMELALKRDAALARNVLARAKAAGVSAAVLVAGGFHSDGIVDELEKAGAAVVVLTPRVATLPEGSGAISGFVRDPLPLEKLFAGQPVSLITPRPMANHDNDDLAQEVVENLKAALIPADQAAGRLSLSDAQKRLSALAREDLPTADNAALERKNSGEYRVTVGDRSFDVSVDKPESGAGNVRVDLGDQSIDFGKVEGTKDNTADILQPIQALNGLRERFALPYYLAVGFWETLAFPVFGLTVLADSFGGFGIFWSLAGFWLAHPFMKTLVGPGIDGLGSTFIDNLLEEIIELFRAPQRSRLFAGGLFSLTFAVIAQIPGAPIWAAIAVPSLLHTLWDYKPHPRFRDPFLSAWRGRAILFFWLLFSPSSHVTIASGDGDVYGAVNGYYSKEAVNAFFWKARGRLQEIARRHGAYVIAGVGGDEFTIILRQPPAEAERILRLIREEYNAEGTLAVGADDRPVFLNEEGDPADREKVMHYRPREVFFDLPQSGSQEDLEAVLKKRLPGALSLVTYGGRWRLAVDRGRSQRSLQDWQAAIASVAGVSAEEVKSLYGNETEGVSTFTVSIGAVSLDRAVRILAAGTGWSPTVWSWGGQFRAKRISEGITWAHRFANDALKVAKGDHLEKVGHRSLNRGRNDVYVLQETDIAKIVKDGRVTKDAVENDRQSRTWSLGMGRYDQLTGALTTQAFRDHSRRQSRRHIYFFTVPRYLAGTTYFTARAFHEAQGSDYDRGNEIIKAFHSALSETIAEMSEGRDAPFLIARSAPDEFFVASDLDFGGADRQWPGAKTFLEVMSAKLKAKLEASLGRQSPWDPTIIAYQVSRSAMAGVPWSRTWYQEAMKDIAELAKKTVSILGETAAAQDPAASMQPGWFNDWAKSTVADFAEVRSPGLIRFDPDKRPALAKNLIIAQGIEQERSLVKLKSVAAARAANAWYGKFPGMLPVAYTAAEGEPIFDIFPELDSFFLETSLTPHPEALAAAVANREVTLRRWAEQFAQRRGVPYLGAPPKSFVRGLEDDAFAWAAADARAAANGREDTANLVAADIANVPDHMEAAEQWGRRAVMHLVTLWVVEGNLTRQSAARDFQAILEAGALAFYANDRFDEVNYRVFDERMRGELNVFLRDAAKLKREQEHYTLALAAGEPLILDATGLTNSTRWKDTFRRLAEAQKATGPKAEIVFVSRRAVDAIPFIGNLYKIAAEAGLDLKANNVHIVNNGALAMGRFFSGNTALAGTIARKFFDEDQRFNIYTREYKEWDLNGVENFASILLYLAGDLLYDASKHLDKTLRELKLVGAAA